MPKLIQIIFRLTLSLIFALFIYWFRKNKEKILKPEVYFLVSLFSTGVSLFLLKIFSSLYSKIDLTILPATLILGIFFIGQTIIKKEEIKEALNSLFIILLICLVGLIIGFGFYLLALFLALASLIIIFLANLLNFITSLKKILKSPPKS